MGIKKCHFRVYRYTLNERLPVPEEKSNGYGDGVCSDNDGHTPQGHP